MLKENNIKIEYRETNLIKSFVKLILGKKCVNCSIKSIIQNIVFFLKVPFIKNETIIYGTGPYDFRFLWYSLLKNKNNFIYHTSHHKWGEDRSSVFLYSFLTPILKTFWMKILKDKNLKIVAVTKESENTLKNNFELSRKVHQIYHSIDIEKFKIETKEYNKRLKILFVGRIVYEKGLDVLVEVINTLENDKFDFTIVGDGNYKDKISSIFKKENVEYLGWINDKEKIASIFKSHDILLNPSIRYKDWEELFGIVNIEAMASGVVVIASDHIGPKEIIENEKNGILVQEKKSELIIQKLNKLYNNREYLKQISNEAIKRADSFRIENIANQWKEVINEK
jgi:glycosyltransferase involved in cell wall biosynthesis